MAKLDASTQKLSRRIDKSSGTFSLLLFFVPAWMIPRVYHSLRRESIKNASSASAIGVQSVRPTWFEDLAVPKGPTPQTDQGQPQPPHGLKLVIKEEVLPIKDQPEFPALALLASRGLLAPDAWKCKRAQVSLKATIDVPMLSLRNIKER